MTKKDIIKINNIPLEDVADILDLNPVKKGSNYFIKNPITNERTASISINTNTNKWKDFANADSRYGNVIDLVMTFNNLEFLEACKFINDKYNLNINFNNDKGYFKNKLLYDTNSIVSDYFINNLQKLDDNHEIIKYLNNRGYTKKDCLRLGIGYAPLDYDFQNLLKEKPDLDVKLLKELNLINSGDYGDKFFFNDRITFNIRNVNNQIIGFGGRSLNPNQPKYLNSKESPIFSKKDNLFGLEKVTENDVTILTEGYFDALSLQRLGFKGVASLGTAFTKEQAKLLNTKTNTVVIAYDSDLAGKKATYSLTNLLKSYDFSVKVLEIENAKDIDELLVNKDKKQVIEILKTSKDSFDYVYDNIFKKYGVLNDYTTKQIIKDITPHLKHCNDFDKGVYLDKLINKLKLNQISSNILINNIINNKENNMAKKEKEVQKKEVQAKEQKEKVVYPENERYETFDVLGTYKGKDKDGNENDYSVTRKFTFDRNTMELTMDKNDKFRMSDVTKAIYKLAEKSPELESKQNFLFFAAGKVEKDNRLVTIFHKTGKDDPVTFATAFLSEKGAENFTFTKADFLSRKKDLAEFVKELAKVDKDAKINISIPEQKFNEQLKEAIENSNVEINAKVKNENKELVQEITSNKQTATKEKDIEK